MKTRQNLAATLLIASFTAGPAGADDVINCAYPFWPGFAPTHLAKELGYFEEEGLEVTEVFDDDRSNVLPALERGDIDCSMRTVGEFQGRPRAPETQGTIIGTIDISLGGDGVIADGSIKTVCDLKGKTFAAEPNTPARLLAQVALKEQCGLTFDDLVVKDIATADAIAVFADESVAGVAAYEPVLTHALRSNDRAGSKVLLSSRDYPYVITDVIVARTDNLRENPEKYRKFLRGIYRAIDFYNKNHKEAVRIIAPNFQLSEQELEETLPNLEYTSYEESLELMGTDGKPGKLHGIFDNVMLMNIEADAADGPPLQADHEIDNSIITNLFDGHKR